MAKDEKKKMQTSWTTNIGEQARQICLHLNRYTQQNDVVVLGESTIFVLNEGNGHIRFQKRFTFTPACFITYNLSGSLGEELFVPQGENPDEIVDKATRGDLKTPGFMTLMGSFEGYLMVYKDIKLAWTTKLSIQPIYVNKAVFQRKNGLIVCLSDTGNL